MVTRAELETKIKEIEISAGKNLRNFNASFVLMILLTFIPMELGIFMMASFDTNTFKSDAFRVSLEIFMLLLICQIVGGIVLSIYGAKWRKTHIKQKLAAAYFGEILNCIDEPYAEILLKKEFENLKAEISRNTVNKFFFVGIEKTYYRYLVAVAEAYEWALGLESESSDKNKLKKSD